MDVDYMHDPWEYGEGARCETDMGAEYAGTRGKRQESKGKYSGKSSGKGTSAVKEGDKSGARGGFKFFCFGDRKSDIERASARRRESCTANTGRGQAVHSVTALEERHCRGRFSVWGWGVEAIH